MRQLNTSELQCVAGAEWEVQVSLPGVEVTISGPESAQEIFSAGSAVVSDAYWGARDAMADFYEWAANGWNYSMACSYQY